MEELLTAVVPLGGLKPDGSSKTEGSGLVVSRGNRCFVVTARHAVEALSGFHLFVIPRCPACIFPPDLDDLIRLEWPRFHPDDSSQLSHDIAVVPLAESKSQVLARGVRPFSLRRDYTPPALPPGTELFVAGYPSSYLATHHYTGDDPEAMKEPLPPFVDYGRLVHFEGGIPEESIRPTGFPYRVANFLTARSHSDSKGGGGLSGGPVFTADTHLFAGVQIAGIDITITEGDSDPIRFVGFSFVPIERVLETMP